MESFCEANTQLVIRISIHCPTANMMGSCYNWVDPMSSIRPSCCAVAMTFVSYVASKVGIRLTTQLQWRPCEEVMWIYMDRHRIWSPSLEQRGAIVPLSSDAVGLETENLLRSYIVP